MLPHSLLERSLLDPASTPDKMAPVAFKHWYLSTRLYGITSKQGVAFIFTAVRTIDLAQKKINVYRYNVHFYVHDFAVDTKTKYSSKFIWITCKVSIFNAMWHYLQGMVWKLYKRGTTA